MPRSKRQPPRRGRRRPRPARRTRAGRAWRFYARHLLLWATVAVLGYWLWLDHEVAATFRNRQWSLPARVYARPLELYPGAPVSRERLLRELGYLGYRRTSQPRQSGQFATSRTRVEYFGRGFEFWDIPEPARRVAVGFEAGHVATLANAASGAPIDLLRLEPTEIGSINPKRFEDRKLLRYDELPEIFVRALVAVEDRRFFSHFGIDFQGLARAMWANIRALRWVQGGSTLTQQLVKNFYLSRERTLARKITEMMMAVSLELRFDKREILETYVNEVFLGQDGNRAIHGFELAAQFYFGKPLAELDIGEMSLLIGMIKGPTVFHPRRHPPAARERRDVVLSVLAAQGVIDGEAAARAAERPVRLRQGGTGSSRVTPAFLALVKRQLLHEYSAEDLNAAGLNVFTTLDLDLQRRAEQATREEVARIEADARQQELQAAIVVVEPRSGEILSLIGDRNPGYAGFNRALDARRPVGSAIKPFIYARALAQPQRYALFTPLADVAVSWHDPHGDTWEPRNFDGREHGRVSLLEALTRSLNLATVNLGLELGLPEVRDYLVDLGVEGDPEAYPSLLLGALDLSPMELAELYTALANDGFRVPLRAISDVTDREHVKLKRYGLKIRTVMQPATAALVRFALTRVVARGTARALRRRMPDVQPLAGKTGTSDDNRDSWFAGFGDNRLAVAWIGRDDNRATGLTGSSGALRLWSAVMQHAGLRPVDLRLPDELAWEHVDLDLGVAVPADCPNGETIPVHRRTDLPHAAGCTGATAPPDASEAPNVWQRLRGLFRR